MVRFCTIGATIIRNAYKHKDSASCSFSCHSVSLENIGPPSKGVSINCHLWLYEFIKVSFPPSLLLLLIIDNTMIYIVAKRMERL